MKFMILLPFVLLLGLAIGGWAPKEELRKLKKEMKALQKRGESDNRMNTFTRMMRIPDRATRPRPVVSEAPVSAQAPTPSAASNAVAAIDSGGSANAAAPRGGRRRQEMSPEDLKARIEEAKEIWKTRVEIARAQWHDRLKLNAEQATLFDDAVNTMNEKLYYAAQDFADLLASSDSLTPEDTTRAINDMTTVLTETYSDFHEIFEDGQRDEVAMIELTDFIDPGVAEPLIAVQDKLENAALRRTPRGAVR